MNGQPRRWSALRKREVVLRLLRGESLEAVAGEINVPILQVEAWRHQFLEAGRAALRARPGSWEARELREARWEIGQLRRKIALLERALGQTAGGVSPKFPSGNGSPPTSAADADAPTIQDPGARARAVPGPHVR